MAHALIFDSGVGGLSVVAEIRKLLPEIQLTYVADDAFRPYGEKTDLELRERLPGLLLTLCEAVKPDLVVIACNTASTTALGEIRSALNIPVVGVVPAIKPAALMSKTGSFAVLGTPATIRRQYVDQLISDFASDLEVVLKGSTKLVALAEEKLSGRPIDSLALKTEIAPLFQQSKIDSIVLACTHFPLIKDEIEAAAPYPVKLIDSGAAIARRVKTILADIPINRTKRIEPDTALLMGPDPDSPRRSAFKSYGFDYVIGLMPE